MQGSLTSLGQQVASAVSTTVSNAISGIATAASNIGSTIQAAYSSTLTWLYQQGSSFLAAAQSIGSSIGQGLATGINATIGYAIQAAQQGVQAIIDIIKRIIQPGSPSKVTTVDGESVGLGLAAGMWNTQTDVEKAITGALRSDAGALWERAGSFGLDGLATGAMSLGTAASDVVQPRWLGMDTAAVAARTAARRSRSTSSKSTGR